MTRDAFTIDVVVVTWWAVAHHRQHGGTCENIIVAASTCVRPTGSCTNIRHAHGPALIIQHDAAAAQMIKVSPLYRSSN